MSQPNPGNEPPANTPGASPADSRPPQYKKPVVRRYDQIEQVKPYGPSEMEAG
jgi:hypothetical protein